MGTWGCAGDVRIVRNGEWWESRFLLGNGARCVRDEVESVSFCWVEGRGALFYERSKLFNHGDGD